MISLAGMIIKNIYEMIEFNEPISKFSVNSPQFKKACEIEKQILEKSGLKVDEEIKIEDIFITKNEWIHTISCGINSENNPAILFLHGYCASNVTFYKMLKQLSEHFKVYCIDILGMGLSARPNFSCKIPMEIIKFFCNSIEKWRQKMHIEDLIIAGHSFGGYIAGFFALLYPKNIKHLILISPAGTTKIQKQQNHLYAVNNYKKMNWKMKILFNLTRIVWNYKLTPGNLYRMRFIPSQLVMSKYFMERFKFDKSEVYLWSSFFHEVLQFPISSEKSAFELFFFPRVCAIIPMEEQFPYQLKSRVTFFYGDSDWMEKSGVQKMLDKNQIQGEIIKIENSGHQIVINNPDELCKHIIKTKRLLRKISGSQAFFKCMGHEIKESN